VSCRMIRRWARKLDFETWLYYVRSVIDIGSVITFFGRCGVECVTEGDRLAETVSAAVRKLNLAPPYILLVCEYQTGELDL